MFKYYQLYIYIMCIELIKLKCWIEVTPIAPFPSNGTANGKENSPHCQLAPSHGTLSLPSGTGEWGPHGGCNPIANFYNLGQS